jgi:ABC-2 type transport system permease protein
MIFARIARYFSIFLTFAKNSLIRELTFRANFFVECITSLTWMGMNLGFYLILFRVTDRIGDTGWGRWEFFVFLATNMIVQSVVQALFMPNCQEISEMIRTGGLDYALLKPIDTQFMVSMQKVDWSVLTNMLAGFVLLGVAIFKLTTRAVDPVSIHVGTVLVYMLFLLCGIAIMYSLMVALAATSIWLGRNQSLYDFWFYITNFSRYPMEIYDGFWGKPLQFVFTYVAPILVVVNVPARWLAQPFPTGNDPLSWLPAFMLVATVGSVLASRWLFQTALSHYRSASS